MNEDRFKYWKEAKYLTLAEAALLIIKQSPDDWNGGKLLKSQPDGFNAVYKDLLEDANTLTEHRYELNEQGEYYADFELNTEKRINENNISWEDGFTIKVNRFELNKWLKFNGKLPLLDSPDELQTPIPILKKSKSKSPAKHDTSLEKFDTLPDSAYVRLPTVMSLFSCSKSTVLRGIGAGRIPKGHKLSPRTTGWLVGDLRTALAKKD